MSVPGSFHVAHLSKRFAKFRSDGHRLLHCLIPSIQPLSETVVLDDLNFTVAPGEALGIVGHNGAGKSTLLKIITGTLAPSSGSVVLNGRVFAILELGMGFNSDMTARENARHVAGLMGISAVEIEAVLPELEAFAEIGAYFDQPMRHYSSGMHMRVAFALATAIRPDILIVDEALSVGDAYFQHKSFERIRQFREQGTTLLFVSHDKSAVLALCDRCILLDQGRLLMDGPPSAVMDYYNALIAEKESETLVQHYNDKGQAVTRSGTGEATLELLELLVSGVSVETIEVGESVILRGIVQCHAPIPKLVMGYMIKDRLGQAVFGINTHLTGQVQEHLLEGERLRYDFAFPANLGPGSYSISISLSSTQTHLQNNYEWRDLALVFTVVNTRHHQFAGCAWIEPGITIRKLS
ncbi:ABC transporter ATP-binding protein [Stutzerimonas stutzeri]|uniref:ABC transporter ATP-binding protein n=1 Tax=Stutzerimonas stutzeri TaxID=316 RepID=UPI001F29A60D|nr:ABC transporter ATP-binding protein [Stutzerimonas stutzeri]